MGQQFGEVAVVTATSVSPHECLQDGVTGQWTERMSSLQLQDDEQG